jgi:hypothetical protein
LLANITMRSSLRFRVRSLIDAFNGLFGQIVAGLIAEGRAKRPFSRSSLTDGLVHDGMLRLRICSAARMPGNSDRRRNLNC